MNLSQKQKNAIENLIIMAYYMKDAAIITNADEEILDASIQSCEKLIEKKVVGSNEDSSLEIAETLIKEINKKS
tara:strand:+ start:423 stop:644 length:222 start_codon:yes stop_codon:yes gene_type:complete